MELYELYRISPDQSTRIDKLAPNNTRLSNSISYINKIIVCKGAGKIVKEKNYEITLLFSQIYMPAIISISLNFVNSNLICKNVSFNNK